jgi:protein-S-isoprenylcysteine O-methyltransferase Ste14
MDGSRVMWRALAAFLALPGVVAFAVPLALALAERRAHRLQLLGLVPVVCGALLLLWCVREFYVAGRGTLAPWDPPRQLVTTGPYRYSRNPMYTGVAILLGGWAILFWSRTLAIYASAVVIGFHLRIVLAEEPWAARKFGGAWEAYRSHVPRWLVRG